MNTPATKSSIARSWPTTLTYVGVGLAFLAATFLIFKFTNFGLWLGTFAVVLAIFGLVFLWMAYGGAGTAPCPACGHKIDGLSMGSNDGKACGGCHHYFEGTGGELWATDDGRIAERALFQSTLPETFGWPEGCCVCGQTVTHNEKISVTRQSGSDSVLAAGTGVVKSTSLTVEVPHCGEHKDGAALEGSKGNWKIRFRSYPFLREFCALNGTVPG